MLMQYCPLICKLSKRIIDIFGGSFKETLCDIADHDVHIGPTNNDEMCNFYLMYWVAGQKPMAIEQGRNSVKSK